MESHTEKVSNPIVNDNDRILALILYIVSLFFPILGPLIIWLIKKDESEFIDYHGREYFNFLISIILYSIVSVILAFLLVGILLIYIVGIYSFVMTIIAAVKAYDGQYYRIPYTLRILQK